MRAPAQLTTTPVSPPSGSSGMPASSRAGRSLGLVDVSRSAAQSFVEARASSRKEGSMGILWIILIVVVVLALLGFFGFRR